MEYGDRKDSAKTSGREKKTGASTEVGEAIALSLAENAVIVVGLARRLEKLRELAARSKGKIHAIKCDISKEDEILTEFRRVEEDLGGVDILINNAGLLRVGMLSDGLTSDWKNVLDTNVIALSICTREALKTMRNRGDNGHIIHINSITGHIVSASMSMAGIYPASKFSVTALTESLRVELVGLKSNIKVTSVSPGLIKTDMVKNAYIEIGTPMESLVHIPPSLDAQDVADAVMYAISTKPHVQVHEIIIRPVGETM